MLSIQEALRRHRGRTALVAALAVSVLGAGTVNAATSTTTPYSPVAGATFNDPTGTKAEKMLLVDNLEKSIKASPKGSTITFSTYNVTLTEITDALIKAHKRGVNVKFLVDDQAGSKASNEVKKELGGNRSKDSWYYECDRGCMSDDKGAIMHSKIYLFSQIGNVKNVAIVSSANLTKSNAVESFNNSYTTVGDNAMYNALDTYVADMSKDKNNENYGKELKSGPYHLWMFPRKDASSEIVAALKQVKCSDVAVHRGSKGRTLVRFAMRSWTDARIDIAKQAKKLADDGCVVQVVTNKAQVGSDVMRVLKSDVDKKSVGSLKVYDVKGDISIHSKIVMISGNFEGKNDARVVFAGSQNFSLSATTRYNETLLRIDGSDNYLKYAANFRDMRDDHSKQID